MVIIYPKDESGTPMALVDGYFQGNRYIEGLAKHLTEVGFRQDTDQGPVEDLIYRFTTVSQTLNDLSWDDRHSSIEHILIFAHPGGSEGSIVTLQNSDGRELLPSIKYILSEMKSPNHCINIVSDPATGDWDRLKKYILFWTLSMQMKFKGQSQYKDFSKFRDTCHGVFETLQELYDQPLQPFLNSIKSTGQHYHYKIN